MMESLTELLRQKNLFTQGRKGFDMMDPRDCVELCNSNIKCHIFRHDLATLNMTPEIVITCHNYFYKAEVS